MAHMHAGLSPAEARKLARQIDRAAARNPVPFQYHVRFRAQAEAPLGQWAYLTTPTGVHQTFSSRKDAERAAKAACPVGYDVSITKTSTEGF